ncbi:MAG TPA: hypothetical protein VNB90_06310 [Cytophagaceae bacterium]|jgi:hypothetical protein|nr:hypothetical protein [Cytophagaceae bacterium]
MMKVNLFALGLVALIQLPSFAQDQKVNPKHINYFTSPSVETKEVKIETQDAVAMMEFVKFKMKITNNTNDYILYKPKESKFKLANTDFSPEDKKTIFIQPLDRESKVIDMKAPAKNAHVDAFKYEVNGLYRIPVDAPVTEAPNFKLPASTNDFTAGNFKVELVNLKKETGETAAKFKVTYIGDGVGLVEPKKISAYGKNHKNSNELTVANDKKSGGIILYKGESETFTATFHMEGKMVDMQLANMEIIWKDTFKESKIIKLDGTSLDFTVDPGLTAGKNK